MNSSENNAIPESQANKIAAEVKSFYKNDFKNLIVKFFKQPIDGMGEILSEDTQKVFKSSLIISASVFLAYIIGIKIIAGALLNLGSCIKYALAPVVAMGVISAVSFGIKSISGKSDIRRELMTGALSGIPLTIMLVIIIIIKTMFMPDASDLLTLMGGNPFGILDKIGYVFLLGLVLFFYSILMLINVFQQSLKSSNTNEAIAWYLSPISVFTSLYISLKIIISII